MPAVERRLFFALWPDARLRAAIATAAAPLLERHGGASLEHIVAHDDLHVTLAFLGAVPEARVAAAFVAASSVDVPGGVQTFDRFEQWGAAGPRVLVPTQAGGPLPALHASLNSSLSAADFQIERRDYRPHITVSRGPRGRVPVPAEGVPAPGPAPRIVWPFASFALVESNAGRGGPGRAPRYAVLATFPLRPA